MQDVSGWERAGSREEERRGGNEGRRGRTRSDECVLIALFIDGFLARFLLAVDCSIISSDAMARGMDLSNIDTVINYDVPTYIQTYVHRVGRTARAGTSGTAYTMVKAQQFMSFRSMLHQADNSFYSKYPVVSEEVLQPMMHAYQQGLAALKQVLQMEKQGEQQTHQPMTVRTRRQRERGACR
jgi:superfamily II DNA/RNA helicase